MSDGIGGDRYANREEQIVGLQPCIILTDVQKAAERIKQLSAIVADRTNALDKKRKYRDEAEREYRQAECSYNNARTELKGMTDELTKLLAGVVA